MVINSVWNNIIKNAGEKFYTKRDRIEFHYTVDGDEIQPYPINGSNIYKISKTTLEKVLENHMPLVKTTQISRIFRAPSYIFAIMTDKRIVQ